MAGAVALRITSPDGVTRGIELDGDSVTIGRRAPEQSPDVALSPDPQRWVGRLHCSLDLVEGMWMVTDNASVNGTLLRSRETTERLLGRRRIQHGDVILILGDMTPDGEPLYWQLLFLDPHTTQQAPAGALPPPPRSVPSLRYDWVSARAYRIVNGAETPVLGLRPQGHQLLRYMVGRSADGAAVACDHAELITALWGAREEWATHRAYTRVDLAGVVRAVRRSIEPDPSAPVILETVKGIGYRLNVSGVS